MDCHYRLRPAEQRGYFSRQVVQRVAVFREDDELLSPSAFVEHFFVVLKEPGELVPFAVLSAHTHIIRLRLKLFQYGYLSFQLFNGAGRRRLVAYSVLKRFQLFRRKFVQVVILVVVPVALL